MKRSALIDVGSNTSKVLVGQLEDEGTWTIIDQVSLPCRLLESSVGLGNSIRPDALARLKKCLSLLHDICLKWEVSSLRTVGTEALRQAENSQEIIHTIRQTVGIELEILSGEEEAQGVADGLRTDPFLRSWKSFHALDIGGGSLEIISVKNERSHDTVSLPLGAVSIARLSGEDPQSIIPAGVIEQTRGKVLQKLKEDAPTFQNCAVELAGCGGTLIFLRQLIKDDLGKDSPHLCLRDIDHYLQQTASLTLPERIKKYPQLPPDRADVFPFGLLGLSCALEHMSLQKVVHSYHNLRHGLLFR